MRRFDFELRTRIDNWLVGDARNVLPDNGVADERRDFRSKMPNRRCVDVTSAALADYRMMLSVAIDRAVTAVCPGTSESPKRAYEIAD